MTNHVDIHALVAEAELLHIATLEISAGRTDLSQSNDELMASFEDKGHDIDMDFGVSLDLGEEDDGRFRVRVLTEVESDPGIIRVNIAAEYELANLGPREVSDDVMLEFVNKVSVMTILPYVRQAIADISQRVFTYPLTMPLFKVDELTFDKSHEQ